MLEFLLEGLKSLERFLARRRDSRSKRVEDQRKSVASILDAVRETEAYLHDLRVHNQIDRGRERELSRLWAQAATDVQAVDARLSRIARMKAMGWANPDLWELPQFSKVFRQLEIVQKQCEWLLKKWD